MENQKVVCPNCKGLGVIGTSVGGSTYDCDVCHGTGYINMFSGSNKKS